MSEGKGMTLTMSCGCAASISAECGQYTHREEWAACMRRIEIFEREHKKCRLPKEDPKQAKEIERLTKGINEVRRVALMHWHGQGFEPVHMMAIANYCVGLIKGEDAPTDLEDAPPSILEDYHEVQRLTHAFEQDDITVAEFVTALKALWEN